MAKNFYSILGVSKNANKDELKKAYRQKAIESHPDKNKGDAGAEERFKEVNEAYSTLSDDNKRKIYDTYGEDGLRAGAGGSGFSGFSSNFGASGANSFQDIFEEAFGGESIFENFFGSTTGRRGQNRGEDLKYEMRISLEQALSGSETSISISTKDLCKPCEGTGSKNKTASTCSTCGGSGRIKQMRSIFSVSSTCHACRGSGILIKDICPSCRGKRIVHARKKVDIAIPPGIEDGQSLRLTGKGHASGHNDIAGDLYILISILPHKYFIRDGNNLICRIPIQITQAVLGSSIYLKNLEGEQIKLTIPPGSQHGTSLRIKNKGMPLLQKRMRGDLLIMLHIDIPKSLSGKAKKLFLEIAEVQGESESPEPLQLNTKKRSFFNF